ncbi:MAG: hypothetical protein HLUCCO02_08665 [Idiomarinaceae bacterium HL-53]|nr:MAG: hypothetical protein HLUCCO02_08665 [Idiomarinaceae bacterium HL-53]
MANVSRVTDNSRYPLASSDYLTKRLPIRREYQGLFNQSQQHAPAALDTHFVRAAVLERYNN